MSAWKDPAGIHAVDAEHRPADGRPIIIGVAGGSGSGKTTVVREITRGLGRGQVTVIHHDAYYADASYLPAEERARINYDHPDSLETPLLVEHLHSLLAGRPVEVPSYDFTCHARRAETETAQPRKVVIVDGILILWEPELRELLDIKVFVDTASDLRFIRRLTRDMAERGRNAESVIHQYISTVRPMHLEFVEPSKRYADIIVPDGGHNRVAVDMLITKVKSILHGQ
ncbi:MAG TPA: uridine kinase [Longimicrobiales bacterium]|nr:uridine kinase [Longimicrobiales bacterium]